MKPKEKKPQSEVRYTNQMGKRVSFEVDKLSSVRATLNKAKAIIRKTETTVTIESIDGVPLIQLFPSAASYIDACTL